VRGRSRVSQHSLIRRDSERTTVLGQRHNASPNDRGLCLSHWRDPSQFVLIYHSTSGVRRDGGRDDGDQESARIKTVLIETRSMTTAHFAEYEDMSEATHVWCKIGVA
jgi:hypothetical protein